MKSCRVLEDFLGFGWNRINWRLELESAGSIEKLAVFQGRFNHGGSTERDTEECMLSRDQGESR